MKREARQIKCHTQRKGYLSKYDIANESEKENGLTIFPYDARCQKLASYDLTPTIIAMSSKKGMLETVYRETGYLQDRYYILVHPKDTVLIVSNEYIIVPHYIAGYISSRVSKVVEGFGHISTTIDPNWSGAMLIAVSNPSNQMLKIYVGNTHCPADSPNQLATVTFHYLNTSCEAKDKERMHTGMRTDLLKGISYTNRHGLRAWFRKVRYARNRKFTDYFFSVCKHMEEGFNKEAWETFLKDFSYLTAVPPKTENTSRKAMKIAKDFIVTENSGVRFGQFLNKHKRMITLLAVIVFYALWRFGLLPEPVVKTIVDIFQMLFFSQTGNL